MSRPVDISPSALAALGEEFPDVDLTEGSHVWKVLSKLLTMDPVEIEEFISSGYFFWLTGPLFARRKIVKLRKFADIKPLRLP